MKYKDPVCPLMLALYGHPEQNSTVRSSLPLLGGSLYCPKYGNPFSTTLNSIDLLLVVYVDDFKMAGPAKNMEKGWKTISDVIDMDPPVPFGRCFG